ncbi:MAG: dihydrolipoyl dehydrogenase [SAR202 cluster bacterium]|nr:dihydrolipoyl dehydrogenase [SAR202 cluster bacterium]
MATYDLTVVGAGPGGYVAAIRAGQLGMKAAIVEREFIGGVCLNIGCIPSKALIRNAEVLSLVNNAGDYGIAVDGVKADYGQAVSRSRSIVDRLTKGVGSLLRRSKVDIINGTATFVGPHTLSVADQHIESRNIIVATGARPRSLPGFDIDGELVMSYREAIVSTKVPGEVVVIGGGAIGVEFAYVYNAYGAKVTIVEYEKSLLPKEDEEVTKLLTRALQKQGIAVMAGTKVVGMKRDGKTATVEVETPDGKRGLRADRVLMAVGIQPNTEGLGIEKAGGTLDRGFIKVDRELKINNDGVYAIGDVTGIMPLAHVASAQGVYVVEKLAGEQVARLDYDAMPRATYCNPQVASIGITEQEAKAKGLDVKIGKFPFVANGKALAVNDRDGLAKVIVDASTGELLGAHFIGHEVTEMLGEFSLARVMEGTSFEIGSVVNAHPTISEAIKEAVLAAEGRAVNI